MTANRFHVGVSLGISVAVASFAAAEQSAAIDTNTVSATNRSHVPALFRPDGKLTQEAFRFTTRAYEREALRLVLGEANSVARELGLPEKFPITEAHLSGIFIVPYGLSHMPPRMIGNVHSRNYGYFVSVDHKLSYVEGAHQEQDCIGWRDKYRWPTSRIDTNSAYQLATQWLAAAKMDVNGLNRECQVRVEPNSYWNAGMQKGYFTPIYDVFWISPQNRSEGYGSAAYVSLFAPTKTLISLRIEESKYILRPPLVFTNLDELLSDPAK